jgi:hypothetical protein
MRANLCEAANFLIWFEAFLLVGVALEGARVRELAELVPDHLFGDEHVSEALAVVDGEGEADELGDDRACATPGLDGRALAGALLHRLGATEQLLVDDRALLE